MKQNVIERQIMWGDLDALGIVFYPRFYEWMDAAAHLYFAALGLEQMALWRGRSIIFGLLETGCSYSRPARYHQKVRIETGIGALGTKTLTLKHRIVSAADELLLVEGFEKRICMDVSDPAHIRGKPVPGDIRRILEQAMNGPPGAGDRFSALPSG